MKDKRTCPVLLSVCFSLVASSLFGAAIESNLTKTFSVQRGGQLVVNVDSGSVDVITGDHTEVAIDVQRKVTGASSQAAQQIFAEHQVSFSQDGDRIDVDAKFKSDRNRLLKNGRINFQVSYRISVPREFNLDLQTAAGSVSSTTISGHVKAKTSGGNLNFADIKGPFDGQTAAGSITLNSATGPVTAKTSGGNLTLGELGGDTMAETSAGSIRIKSAKGRLTARTRGGNIDVGSASGDTEIGTAAGSLRVELAHSNLVAKSSGGNITINDAHGTVLATTAAGSVNVAFVGQPNAECKLTTSGGNIDVKLLETLSFDVDARTSGGRVTTDLPVTETAGAEQKKDSLRGKLNHGGPTLVLKTSAGNISIKKQ
jgi:DUF4097 and DUF4098 domain-containing protein YvlB